MSIIHDALKKAQSSLQSKTSPVIGQPLTVDKSKGKIIWFVLVLLVIALSAGYTYWQTRMLKDPPVAAPTMIVPPQKEPPPPLTQAKVEPKVEPKAETAGALNIHGIMSDPKGNVALINDRIYAEGDEVNGTRIVKINLDGIVISRDGKEETIRVGQH